MNVWNTFSFFTERSRTLIFHCRGEVFSDGGGEKVKEPEQKSGIGLEHGEKQRDEG